MASKTGGMAVDLATEVALIGSSVRHLLLPGNIRNVLGFAQLAILRFRVVVRV